MKSDMPTRVAFRAEDTPEELIEALRNADYSHLPSLDYGSLTRAERDALLATRFGIEGVRD